MPPAIENSAMLDQRIADLDMMYGPKASLPGLNLDADQNADGTWNIRRVPMFASHKMLPHEGGHEVDLEWQLLAIKRHQELWAEGPYLNPYIIQHHGRYFDDGNNVRAAGYFLPMSVGKMRVDGEEKNVTFCDLMYVDEWTYGGSLRSGRLPYISSEFSYVEYEHVHLSALDHHAPWFKFPMITIGRERPFVDESLDPDMPDFIPATAIRHARERVLAYRQSQKETATMPPKPTTRQDHPDETDRAGDDEPNSDDAQRVEDEAGQGMKAVLEMLAQVKETLAGLGATIEKILGGGAVEEVSGEGDGEPDTTDPVEMARADSKKTVAKKPAATKAPPVSASSKVAAVEAERDSALAKLHKFQTAASDATAIRDASKAARSKGVTITDERLEEVLTKHGIEGLDAYVEALRDHAPAVPPATWDGEQDVVDEGAQHPDAVIAYRELGKTEFATAIRKAAEYKLAKSRGWLPKDQKLETYLEDNVGPLKKKEEDAA